MVIRLLLILALVFAQACTSEVCELTGAIQKAYCPTTTTSVNEPEFCGTISIIEVEALLVTLWDTERVSTSIINLWDREYRLVSKECMQEFLDLPQNDTRQYDTGEWFDCDDYTKVLTGKVMQWAPGLAFGSAVIRYNGSASHASNIMIDCDHNIIRIEPQGNNMFDWDYDTGTIFMGVE